MHALRWHQALRRRIPEAAAESRVRGAAASGELEGASMPVDVVRDIVRGASTWSPHPDPVELTLRGVVAATAETEHVAPGRPHRAAAGAGPAAHGSGVGAARGRCPRSAAAAGRGVRRARRPRARPRRRGGRGPPAGRRRGPARDPAAAGRRRGGRRPRRARDGAAVRPGQRRRGPRPRPGARAGRRARPHRGGRHRARPRRRGWRGLPRRAGGLRARRRRGCRAVDLALLHRGSCGRRRGASRACADCACCAGSARPERRCAVAGRWTGVQQEVRKASRPDAPSTTAKRTGTHARAVH